MSLTPDQFPTAILPREFAKGFISAVVGMNSGGQVFSLANVEPADWVLQNVHPKHRLAEELAPETGLEPVTRRLTAGCSTIELLWNPKAAPWASPVNPDLGTLPLSYSGNPKRRAIYWRSFLRSI